MIRMFISIFILAVTVQPVLSQEEELIIDPSNAGRPCVFVFENQKGSVNVTGYEGTLVMIKASPRFASVVTGSEVEGLNRLPLHRLNLLASVSEGEIELRCESDDRTVDLEILIPRDFSVRLGTKDNGEIRIIRIDGEIEVENPVGDITVENVRGPVVLNSVSGNVTASFSTVITDMPSMMTSFHGNIELRIPENSKLSFNLKSQKGDVLSDLQIEMEKRTPRISAQNGTRIYRQEDWSIGHLNKGGNRFIISTYWGNILITSNNL